MKFINKLLFWITKKEYLITANGPSTFGVIFKNGDTYLIDGARMDAVHFECKINNLRRLPGSAGLPQKDENEIIRILKFELEKRGMVITCS